MFYDERIHTGRGKAFRKTMVFATVLFFLYAVIHTVYQLIAMPSFNPVSIMTESLCALIGLGLILYGEIAFAGSQADERKAYQKDCYFAKAFYYLLYSVAGACCVIAPIYLLSDNTGYPPNTVLFFIEIPCWLFLLLQFKKDEIPINAEILLEDKKIYWTKVLKNILKFGGVCVGLTCFSFTVTLFYLVVYRSDVGLFSLAVLLAILFAGLLTWISLSLEYALFSVAERVSEKAKQKGTLSPITIIFLWVGIGAGIAADIGRIIISAAGYEFNSADIVVAFNYIDRSMAVIGGYFTGLFLVYFLSELRALPDRKLVKILSGNLLIRVINYVYGVLSSIIFMIMLDMYGGNPEAEYIFYVNSSMLSTAISVFFMIIYACLAGLCFKILSGYTLAGKWYWAVPVLTFFIKAIDLVLNGIIMIVYDRTAFWLLSVVGTTAIGILYCLVYKKIKEKPLLSAE